MNWMDLAVAIILTLSTFIAYKVGFVKTCLGFGSTIIGLILSYNLYPITSKLLRESTFGDNIKKSVAEFLDLQGKTETMALNTQNTFINDLNLPDFLKNILVENNNSEIYNVLNVSQIEDYISGYLANIIINVIALIGTFIVVWILLIVLSFVLDLASKLPVLNFINKTAGGIVGFLMGLIVIWIGCLIIMSFYANPNFAPIIAELENSKIASIFYNNNLLVFMVTRLFI